MPLITITMRIIFGLIIAFLISTSVFGQSTAVFTGSYDDLQYKARTESKYYIVDFYTTWCRPCKAMEQDVIETYEFNKLLESGFLFYKLDGESVEGDRLADAWGIEAYPTYIIFNSQGNEVGRLIGYYAKSTFIEKLKGFKYKPANQKYSDFR